MLVGVKIQNSCILIDSVVLSFILSYMTWLYGPHSASLMLLLSLLGFNQPLGKQAAHVWSLFLFLLSYLLCMACVTLVLKLIGVALLALLFFLSPGPKYGTSLVLTYHCGIPLFFLPEDEGILFHVWSIKISHFFSYYDCIFIRI